MAVSHQDVSLQDVSHQDVCGQAYSELAVGQWLPEGRGKVTDALRKGELTADVVVIGGGITGAGIAREAARRGLKTVLVERQDFAWGTSSRSSKMVHGGLRYMASGDIKTTLHSVHERERLMREAPGLVDRMDYMMAHYRGQFPGPLLFNLLLFVYDTFAGKRYRKFVYRDELIKAAPGIKTDSLMGGTCFSDAVTDDSRLVLRVLHEAMADGALCLNYMGVQGLIQEHETERVTGVNLCDGLRGEAFTLQAGVVINATGAWADELRGQLGAEHKIRPARGSHIVIPRERLPVKHSFTVLHPDDQRPIFIYPWESRTVIGTTDLDNGGIRNTEVGITAEELAYLLKVTQYQFPGANVVRGDVISSWAGVRPLVSSGAKNPSKEKRDHSIWEDNGLISVSGGKLTTFRLIALDVLQHASKYLNHYPQQTFDETVFNPSPLPTSGDYGLSDEQLKRLYGFYGAAMKDVAGSEADNTLINGTLTMWSELRWAARNEAVMHLDDLLLRRTRLGLLLADGGLADDESSEAISAVCCQELGWSESRWQQEKARYLDIWHRYYSLPQFARSAS